MSKNGTSPKQETVEGKKYYTIKELCELVGMSRRTIQRRLADIGKSNKWTYLSDAELERLQSKPAQHRTKKPEKKKKVEVIALIKEIAERRRRLAQLEESLLK